MPLTPYTLVDPSTNRPLLDVEESISFTADNIELYLGADKREGKGTLFVTTKHLIWLSSDRSTGYRTDYPYVLLHAVSRDPSSFPRPCLYAQLDEEEGEEQRMQATLRQSMPSEGEEEEEEEGEEHKESEEENEPDVISELRFVPDNPDILDSLYRAVSACAALNPDESGSEGEGDFVFNVAEGAYQADGDEADEDGEAVYGEGGESVDNYGMSNEARLAAMQMSMGMSAEEMYGEDAEGEYEGDEEGEEDHVTLSSKQPDDGSAQLASAAAQVSSSGQGSSQKKRDRDGEDPQADTQETSKKVY